MAENATVALADEIFNQVSVGISGSSSSVLRAIAANEWLLFGCLVLAGFIFSYALVYISKTIIHWFTRRTETDIDDKLLGALQHPVAFSIFLLALSVAFVPLTLSSRFAWLISKLILSGNILLIATIVNRILRILLEHAGSKITKHTQSRIDDSALPLIRRMITVIIYVLASLIVLGAWGVDVGPLLAGAGIAGIAIAFALQESLKNIFGGVSLAFDNAFSAGDRVKLGDGTVGTVVDVSLRSTKIRTFTGDLVVVPNGKIANENFQTYAQPTHHTRVVIDFGVAYGADIDKVRDSLKPLLKKAPDYYENIAEEREAVVEFVEMGPYSLNFRAGYWVNDYTNSWKSKLWATEQIYRKLQELKVEIPYPTQTLHLRKE